MYFLRKQRETEKSGHNVEAENMTQLYQPDHITTTPYPYRGGFLQISLRKRKYKCLCNFTLHQYHYKDIISTVI